jgi:hypothetical protein
MKSAYRILSENLKGRDNFENLSVAGRIILKMVSQK